MGKSPLAVVHLTNPMLPPPAVRTAPCPCGSGKRFKDCHGALDARARHINEAMKLAAAHAIAGVIGPDELSAEYIIPSVFDTRVVEAVAKAASAAAVESGSARRTPSPEDGVPIS